MIKKRNVLLTGATGFLGTEILSLLLEDNCFVFLVVRASSEEQARSRIVDVLSPAIFQKHKDSLRVFQGDVSRESLGLDKNNYSCLLDNVEEIYHCAASIGFDLSLKESRSVNVEGTRHVLSFAKSALKIKKLNYVGTTFIAGDARGDFSEDSFDSNQGFNNYYEQSKFEAEKLVRSIKTKKFIKSIFRPSVIVGNYSTGETKSFKMFYEPMYMFSRDMFDRVPANPATLHNLVPVDYVAKAMILLSNTQNQDEVYHLVSPADVVCGKFFNLAAKYFGFKNPEFIPIENFDLKELTPAQARLLKTFLPYFNYKATFSNIRTDSLLKKLGFVMPAIDSDYFIKMFSYLERVGFIKRR